MVEQKACAIIVRGIAPPGFLVLDNGRAVVLGVGDDLPGIWAAGLAASEHDETESCGDG